MEKVIISVVYLVNPATQMPEHMMVGAFADTEACERSHELIQQEVLFEYDVAGKCIEAEVASVTDLE